MSWLNRILVMGVAICAPQAKADVFTLAPGETRSGNGERLRIWDEPVVVNGYPTRLTIDISEERLGAWKERILREFASARFATGAGGALTEILQANGGRRRLYGIDMGGGGYSLVQFGMELPAGGLPQGIWPMSLPSIPGAVVKSVFEYPERKSASVQFELGGEAESEMSNLGMQLSGSGWRILSGGGGRYDAGQSGMMLISDSGDQILTVGLKSAGNGVSRGVMLKSTLKAE